MARSARGFENMEWAREVLARAQTIEQLRQAQAVVLPLDYGLSLEQTARAIGRSVTWTCRLRNRFLAGEIAGDGQRQTRRAATPEHERRARARSAGPFSGPGAHRRYPGGRPGQDRARSPAGAGHGAALGVQPAAPARLAQARPRPAAPAKRPLGSAGVERNLPERLAQARALWPEQTPIKLMFQDEARFGRINDVRRCWAPKPIRPLCQAMLTHEYTYAYAAVDVLSGELDSLILPHVNTHCMQLFLDEVGQRHPNEHIVMVLDGAGWHASGALRPPANMRLLSLPPYAPELNPVAQVWDELREKQFHNHVFDSLDALEDHLEIALRDFELDVPRIQSIVAWPWIIDALLK